MAVLVIELDFGFTAVLRYFILVPVNKFKTQELPEKCNCDQCVKVANALMHLKNHFKKAVLVSLQRKQKINCHPCQIEKDVQ